MKKSIYIAFGFILAGIAYAGFWALNKQPEPLQSVKEESRKISLLTINYIPLTPPRLVENGKFWEIPAVINAEPVQKTFKELRGKPVILHFWATWCGPCVQELPGLDSFAQKHAENFHIVAVATDVKDIPKIRAFYSAKGIKNLKINLDRKSELSHFFRPAALPTTIFINSRNEEIGRISGMVEWEGLAGRLLNTYLHKY